MTRLPADYVWGVDVAVSKVAFGFAALGWTTVESETVHFDRELRGGRRLGLMDRRLRMWARNTAKVFPPVAVFVEQPSGRWRNPELAYAAGVVQAALFEALGVEVVTITSGEWKKATVGTGKATKQQVGAWVRRFVDPDVFDEDQCDAVGIAFAGRLRVCVGEKEAA